MAEQPKNEPEKQNNELPEQPGPPQPQPEDVPAQQPEDSSSEYTITFEPSVIQHSRPVVVPTATGGLQIRVTLQNNKHSKDVRVPTIDPTTGEVIRVDVTVTAEEE